MAPLNIVSTRKTRDNGVEVLSSLVWRDNVDTDIIIVRRYESSRATHPNHLYECWT